jgi:hypothetical protein
LMFLLKIYIITFLCKQLLAPVISQMNLSIRSEFLPELTSLHLSKTSDF